jgi:hypothetical protein
VVLPVVLPVVPVVPVVLPVVPVVLPGVPEAAEPELMSALVPVPAPMEVPPPVVVLGVVPREPLAVVLLVVSDGDVVVEGIVLEVVELDVSDEDVAASSFLPQALRDRAAIRARAAHCAIGDLIIRNSFVVRASSKSDSGVAACGSL